MESEELKLSDGEGPQALFLESPRGHHRTVRICPEGSGSHEEGVWSRDGTAFSSSLKYLFTIHDGGWFGVLFFFF